MKKLGLNQQELDQIISIFRHHPEIKKVIIFGSRAKGISRLHSDIDLAVDGIVSDLQIETLAMELDAGAKRVLNLNVRDILLNTPE